MEKLRKSYQSWTKFLTIFLLVFWNFVNAESHFQQTVITGVVVTTQGEVLPGVNVLEKGTSNGVVTDFEGNFRITLSDPNGVLIFSYIGFETKELSVLNATNLRVVLNENVQALDDVVVIGYGTRKKADLTGAVSTVDGDAFKETPITTIEQSLDGRVSGVQIRQNGAPGSGPEILIRGIASTGANNAPLYVVDGIPLGNVDSQRDNFVLNAIDPTSIESVSVLKDASSKAIYGSRASNGVVLITTKRGKLGKPTITFGSTVGFQSIPEFEEPDVLNAEQLRQFRLESFEDRLFAIGVLGPREIRERDRLEALGPLGEGTNWFDEITRDAPFMQFNVGVNGGSENIKYNVSLNHLYQDGTLLNTSFRRYSIRANMDVKISDNIRFGINLAPTQTIGTGGRTDAGADNFQIFNAVSLTRWTDPSAPVFREDGTLTNVAKGDIIDFFNVNPVYLLEAREDERETNQLLASSYVEVDIIEGLVVRTVGSLQYLDRRENTFEPSDFPGVGALTPNVLGTRQANASVAESNSLNLIWENTLNYKTVIADDHSIDALFGFTIEDRSATSTNIFANDIIDESITLPSFGNTNPENVNNFTGNSAFADNALVSILGRLDYNFKERYYLTASIRRDGSSKFGEDEQYGNFPSIAGAWRVTNEPFFDKIDNIFSDLKFEIGYGESGSNANIGNFQAQGQIGAGPDFVFGDVIAPGSSVSALPNSALTWEESKETNLGIDVGFLDNRIYLSADYYYIKTEGFLAGLPLPSTSGFGGILTNLGSIRNSGLEFELQFQNILNSDTFRWNAQVNFTTNKSKVLELAAESGFIRPSVIGRAFTETKEGEEVGLYRGFKVTGLFSQEELDDPNVPKYPGAVVGSLQYEDGNGDGVLGDEEDFLTIGNPNPDFTFGITQNFSYKSLDLSVVMAGSVGQQIYNGTIQFNGNQDGVFNVEERQLNRWRPGQDTERIAIPGTASVTSRQKFRLPNTFAVDDADYLWVKNITLGYNLNGRLIDNIFQNARIYTSVQNPFLFTEYDNGNPEINRSGDTALVRNVNTGSFPISRTFTLGLNVTF